MWCCRAVLRAGGGLTGAGEALMENLVVCGFGGWQVVTHRNQNSGRTMSQEVSGQPASHQAKVLPQRPHGPSAGVLEGCLAVPFRHRRHHGGGAQCQCF